GSDEQAYLWGDADRSIPAGVARRVGIRDASDDVIRGAQGHRERSVHVPADLAIRALEVDGQARAANRDLGTDADFLRIAGARGLQVILGGPCPSRERLDGGSHAPFRVVEEFPDVGPKAGHAPLVRKFRETPRAEFIGGHLRAEIAESFSGIEGLLPEPVEDRAPLLAAVE